MSLLELETENAKNLHLYLIDVLRETIRYEEYFKVKNRFHIRIDYYDWDKVEEFLEEDYDQEYRQNEIFYNMEAFDDHELVFHIINYLQESQYVDDIFGLIKLKEYNTIFHIFTDIYTKWELWEDYVNEIKKKWLIRKKKRCKMDVSLYNILVKFYAKVPHQLVEGEIYINIMSYLRY